jgi:aromatic-L-amino-acid/L-tryptophan decarboxylase
VRRRARVIRSTLPIGQAFGPRHTRRWRTFSITSKTSASVPVWQPIPDEVQSRFRSDLPESPSDLAAVHQEFMRHVMPFATGNVHPGFMGWVHGGGTAVGMLAEMLVAGLNANLGGRDHVPIQVERQIVQWMRRIFGFPESATGLFVTGTSAANLIAVLIARDTELGFEVRCAGVAESSRRLTTYTSVAAHRCIGKAMDIAGLGSDALRLIPVDGRYRIDLNALEKAIQEDRRVLGGHLKTGHTWPLQNRPTELHQDKSIYNPPTAIPANIFRNPA